MIENKKYYGVVEGFFSRPLMRWNAKERMITLQLIHTYAPELNCYLYCPKDDPFVTQRPFELYDEYSLSEIIQAVDYCNDKNITFVYGINPTFVIEDIQKQGIDVYCDQIMNKLMQLKTIGVNDFCLLYDDIPFAYNYLSGSQDPQEEEVANLMANVVNILFGKLSPEKGLLWFCSPEYFFQSNSVFNHIVCKTIDARVGFIYTGNKVFTGYLDNTMTNKMRSIVGNNRPVIFWDNYPVNDEPIGVGQYFYGARNKPSDQALSDVDAILVNPMREPYISLPNYISMNNYLSNPNSNYDRHEAYSQARKQLGDDGSLALFTKTRGQTNCVDKRPQGLRNIEFEGSLSKLQWIDTLNNNYQRAKKQIEYIDLRVQVELLKGLEPLFMNAKNMLDTFGELHNNVLKNETFNTINQFPLIIKKTGVKGILRLILNYLQLYYTATYKYITFINTSIPITDIDKELDFLEPLIECYNYILGKNSIHISEEWEQKYQTIVGDILKYEGQLMYNYLVNTQISFDDRISVLSTRFKTFVF